MSVCWTLSILIIFQKKLGASDTLPPMNHRQARPLDSVQGAPLFLNSGDSLVFPLNKEELLLRKDEGEKANGLM